MRTAVFLCVAACWPHAGSAQEPARPERALLISVDGMHAVDLAHYVESNPDSTLAQLGRRGLTYTNARTPLLGDSSPGLLSLATGGSPSVTGIIYSPTYDRSLSPATSKDCSERGTVVYIDEKAVKDNSREDSGGGIDPDKLPRDPARGCAPVFPRQLVRVNTLFEVVKRAGGRTAWIDQHDMYNDLLLGPSGGALDDSRALERKGAPGTLEGTTGQDGRRVELLLSQIRGLDSAGKNKVGVPKVFGMGFISFGVMQKSEGYPDATGHPGDKGLRASLDFVDKSLGRIVAELKAQKIFESTLLIVSSKHGQSPIDVRKRRVVDRNVVRTAVNGVQDGLLAHASLDAIGLLWLKDSRRADQVAEALRAKQDEAGIQKLYWGEAARMLVNSPSEDSRAPDIVIQPELGVFYADNLERAATQALLAEHGGMLDEDTNVPLLLSFAGASGGVNKAAVQTSQVAPTILVALGLDPSLLDAVRKEGTPVLPGMPWGPGGARGMAGAPSHPAAQATPPPGRYAAGRPRPRPEPPELQPKVDPRLQPYRPLATNLSGRLKGMASDILPGVGRLWIDGFRKHHPNVTVDLEPPYGGRIGAAELIQGGVDFALVSRELIPTDISQFQARFGYPPLSLPISGGSYRHFGFLDALGVIVSRDNPLEKITYAQFDAIFSSTRHRGNAPIRKWGELGLTGDWADKDIHPYAVKPWNGFEEFVRQRVLSTKEARGEWRPDIAFEDLIFPMTTQISRDEYGISYTGFAFLMTGVKVVAVAEDERGPYSTGSFADVASWRYPLARVFYINVNRAPGKPLDPKLAELIRFILSRDGQQLVVEDGLFIPLAATLAEESRKQVEP